MSDNCFTQDFFGQFPDIEEKTIEALVTNGFHNQWSLFFLDVDKHLHDKGISIGQICLLREILGHFQESQKNAKKDFKKNVVTICGKNGNRTTNGVQTGP